MAKAKQAPGFDAVPGFGGHIRSGERDTALSGSRAWKTRADLQRLPPVVVWSRLRHALFAGVTWTVVPNDSGHADAERGAELVRKGLVEARLPKPWNAVAAESLQGAAAFGHSIHATSIGRTRDGDLRYTDIALRPQHSITEWHRKNDSDPRSPWTWVLQRLDQGNSERLDLVDCLHVTNTNGVVSASPVGVAMLDLIYERAKLHKLYERIEGTEILSSMGGIPIARIPLGKIKAQLEKLEPGKTEAEYVTLAQSVADGFLDFVSNRFKDPDGALQWWALDSATYQGVDPNTISSIYEWGLEIIKADLQGLVEIGAKERALILDIARMLGVEHMFIGGDSTGAYSMHESKIQTLAADLNAELELWSYYADQQLVRPLVAMNMLDPDDAAPSLQPSSVMPQDVAKVVATLVQLGMTQLPRNGLAMKSLLARLEVPFEEQPEPVAPRFFGARPFGSDLAPTPAPNETDPEDPKAEEPTTDVAAEDITREEQPE